jgi:hypothetical protein
MIRFQISEISTLQELELCKGTIVRITRNVVIYLVGRSWCFYGIKSNGVVGKLIGVDTNFSLFVGPVLKKKAF